MAATKEGLVKAKVRKILQAHKVYCFAPAANGFGRTGIPDFVCCVNGYFFAIECKAGTNKPTALQRMEISGITDAGGVAIVVNEDNLGDIAKIIEGLRGKVPC